MKERAAWNGAYDCRRASEETGRYGGILRRRNVLCSCVSSDVKHDDRCVNYP